VFLIVDERKQEKNEIKEANDFESQRTRAGNNREKKGPGKDEEKGRASQEDLRMYYIFSSRWLSRATAFTASLVGPSGSHPMSASQDTPFMRPRNKVACLGLDADHRPRTWRPMLLARVFGGREGTGGGLAAGRVWLALTRGAQSWSVRRESSSRFASLETSGALRQAAASYCRYRTGRGQPATERGA